ncbi:hypothetical protein ACFL59_09950 [Planctomycetota bacterium]
MAREQADWTVTPGTVRPFRRIMVLLLLLLLATPVGASRLSPGSRRSSNDSSAIATLRTLAVAQQVFRDRDRDGDGVRDYAANLGELRAFDLIDRVLGSGVKRGYRFSLTGSKDSWHARAEPLPPARSAPFSAGCGRGGCRYRAPVPPRWFYIDETSVIRFSYTAVVGPASAEL